MPMHLSQVGEHHPRALARTPPRALLPNPTTNWLFLVPLSWEANQQPQLGPSRPKMVPVLSALKLSLSRLSKAFCIGCCLMSLTRSCCMSCPGAGADPNCTLIHSQNRGFGFGFKFKPPPLVAAWSIEGLAATVLVSARLFTCSP